MTNKVSGNALKTFDLRSLGFTGKELSKIMNDFDDGEFPSYLQNLKALAEILNDFKYSGTLNKESIMRFLYPPPKIEQLSEVEVPSTEEFYEERRHDDEYYNNEIAQLEKLRDEIDNRIKELKYTENEIEDLMNIPVSESETQKSHEERYKNYFQESTQNLLDGDFDETLSEEGTKFIKKHKLQFIDSEYPCILLSPPIDEEKFKTTLKHVSYGTNTIKKEDHELYINYYLNKVTGVNKVFELLDQIANETLGTYKILCDCGFIVEDSHNVSYERTAPKEDEVERSIPFVIKNAKDMKTYKHYIYSFISEKMEATHKSSSHHYIAIHTFLFKVIKLNKTGIKFNVSGYAFLSKLRCVRHIQDDKNLCYFNALFGI